MVYHDQLYGIIELPDFIERLMHTREMIRLRNITQSVLPNYLLPHGPIPSRFQHGLGACYLATVVLKNNPTLSNYDKILPVAALLHDAGNPPLSHLGENFLKEVTGKDGESFLEDILDGSETEKILKEMGVSAVEIVSLVMGQKKPVSDIVNGSMDVDNLDNVGRYNLAAGLGAKSFAAVRIAASFRFSGSEWTLLDECYEEVKKWQEVRSIVYRAIYGAPTLNVTTMVYRALELAFGQGKIKRDFFFLDDAKAVEFLHANCGSQTSFLIDRALRWDWYEEVFCLESAKPTPKFKTLAVNWKSRKIIADRLSQELNVPAEMVAVYIGEGRDKRKVTIPFVAKDGLRKYDNDAHESIYRFKVYIPQELFTKKELIKKIVEQELGVR